MNLGNMFSLMQANQGLNNMFANFNWANPGGWGMQTNAEPSLATNPAPAPAPTPAPAPAVPSAPQGFRGNLWTEGTVYDAMGNQQAGGRNINPEVLNYLGLNPNELEMLRSVSTGPEAASSVWSAGGGPGGISLGLSPNGDYLELVRGINDRQSLGQRFGIGADGFLTRLGEAYQFDQGDNSWGGIAKDLVTEGAPFVASVLGAAYGLNQAGLLPGASSAAAENLTPALIESMVGSPGYGASSVGAGNAMSAAALDQLYNMPANWAAESALAQQAPAVTSPVGGGGSLLDYGLNTAPAAQTGGVLGGTSNGLPGGIGEGLQAVAGPGTALATASGTGQGIGVMNPITGAMGPTTGQLADFASNIGSSLPPVGQSLLPPGMQTPNASSLPTPNAPTPTVPGGTGGTRPGGGGAGGLDTGALLGSIFGMYNANKNRERYDELIRKLDDLYAPSSPYAQQMRDELERRDSAAGRASQYGPRSVELAAKLTDSRRQALGQMTVPLAASMMMSDRLANNTNNLFTNPNGGNIFDGVSSAIEGAQQIGQFGQSAWNWVNKTFPDLFGDNGG